ncbi:MAG TPA: stage V sporulation protein E, partial [Candidatus Hydrogenedentes bacterium]|nr:stage V sporulation protein E [Candidatus Hydrogenedentota bacterium]
MKYDTCALMLAVLALVLLGVLMVFSTSAVGGASGSLLNRQIAFATAGFAALLLLSRFDYHRFADPVVYVTLVVFSFALLCLVLAPG